MKVYALTGGIGSGKSFVADCFFKLGVPVIDTDTIAAEFTSQADVQQIIIERFGESIFPNNQFDRKRLRDLIFRDETARTWLEAYLHPLILDGVDQRVRACDAPYVIVVIPLLVEVGLAKRYSGNIVVDVPVNMQRERTIARDNITPAAADAIIASQTSRAMRLDAADHVIKNDGSQLETEAQVQALHAVLS